MCQEMSDPEGGFKRIRGVKSTMSQFGLKRNSKGEGALRDIEINIAEVELHLQPNNYITPKK